ncbi:MAG: hypothetical protein H5T75_08550 [Coriobacteriia bacterium]|nr:hypothetical protein [Coriobacteriia bacterium]MDI6844353.1 hypothetical protein [Anaerosomatales bacterium]
MADENIQTPQQPEQAKGGFFSTSTGKLVMVVAALAVLAIVAGVAVAFVLKVVLPQPQEIEIRVPQQQQGSKPATPTAGEQPASPAPAVSYDEVFRFRDIFDPLIKPVEETSAEPTPSETTTDTGDVTDYAADTLYLISISTTGDTPSAVMVWDRQQYTLQEGDAIPDSPWRLLEIRTTSVVMLYGDQQVVLSVGQGIQK